MGQWPTLHTHHFHTGTTETLDVILMDPHFQAWKTSFHLCDNLGSIWHQGADGKMSPVSTSIQLHRWIHCIMGTADVILPIMRFLQVEMNYFGQKLLKNSNTHALIFVEKRSYGDIIPKKSSCLILSLYLSSVNSLQHVYDAGFPVKTYTEGWVCEVIN